MASDISKFEAKIQPAFNHLVIAKEQLETFKTYVKQPDRICQVTQDTFSINGSYEIVEDLDLFDA